MERVADRDGLQRSEIEDRMNKQLPEEELLRHAHFIIHNDPDHLLIPQVWAIHQALLAESKSR